MTEFKASNGVEIRPFDDLRRGAGYSYEEVEALREFFQAERDAELGRWRWPEHPDYVVYPNKNHSVSVIDESTGVREESLTRDETNHDIPAVRNVFFRAAKAYFDAHPERKPWHDAEPGDVWELTVPGKSALFVASDDRFSVVSPPDTVPSWYPRGSSLIEAGKKIYSIKDGSLTA